MDVPVKKHNQTRRRLGSLRIHFTEEIRFRLNILPYPMNHERYFTSLYGQVWENLNHEVTTHIRFGGKDLPPG